MPKRRPRAWSRRSEQAAASLTTAIFSCSTYSGHGGQVDDVNGDEDDALDETWVLWDRQLIDDELFSLWSQFAPGVRITMLSDSCHSGTVLRMIATFRDVERDAPNEGRADRCAALRSNSLSTALDLDGNGSLRRRCHARRARTEEVEVAGQGTTRDSRWRRHRDDGPRREGRLARRRSIVRHVPAAVSRRRGA